MGEWLSSFSDRLNLQVRLEWGKLVLCGGLLKVFKLGVQTFGSTTSADGSKYGSTIARCNYSLSVLLIMDEGITRNMQSCLYRNIVKLYIVAFCWTISDIDSRCMDP